MCGVGLVLFYINNTKIHERSCIGRKGVQVMTVKAESLVVEMGSVKIIKRIIRGTKVGTRKSLLKKIRRQSL